MRSRGRGVRGRFPPAQVAEIKALACELPAESGRPPSRFKDGRALRIEAVIKRTGALRFGDQRAMALAGAVCHIQHAVIGGFINNSLRGLLAGHLDQDDTASKMSYDLQLGLHGLIERLPHRNKNVLTPDGIRVAVFYTHAALLAA